MFQLLAKQERRDQVDPLALQVAHMADRLQLVRRTVVPALEGGEDVIVDRYLAGALGALSKWGIEESQWFDDLCGAFPTPTLSVYLYVSFDEWEARMERRVVTERTNASESKFLTARKLGIDIAGENDMLLLDTSDLTVSQAADAVVSELEEKKSSHSREMEMGDYGG